MTEFVVVQEKEANKFTAREKDSNGKRSMFDHRPSLPLNVQVIHRHCFTWNAPLSHVFVYEAFPL
jgi:hypothetical protein